jgi:hypothetical protein
VRLLSRDESGSITVLSALLFTVLLGAAALCVDVANAYSIKAQLQNASDAASLAAAKFALTDQTSARNAALDLATKNVPASYGKVTKSTDVEFGTWDKTEKTFTVSPSNITAVRVYARRTVASGNAAPVFFAGAIGARPPDIVSYSIATIGAAPKCLVALSTANSTAVDLSGSASVKATNCEIGINSPSSSALRITGSGGITATKTSIVGGYSGGASKVSPSATTGSPASSDPLSGLAEPSSGSCNNNFSSNTNTFIYPGTYCGSFSITGGTAKFQPGIYYFKNATVSISSNASVTGSGVLFFLDKDSTFSLTAGGSVSLSPPATGPYAGILFFHSKLADASKKITIGGTGTMTLGGAFYAPSSNITITGNGSLSTINSGYIISSTLTVSGSGSFNVSRPSVSPATLAGKLALVE